MMLWIEYVEQMVKRMIQNVIYKEKYALQKRR